MSFAGHIGVTITFEPEVIPEIDCRQRDQVADSLPESEALAAQVDISVRACRPHTRKMPVPPFRTHPEPSTLENARLRNRLKYSSWIPSSANTFITDSRFSYLPEVGPPDS